jgi:hypothetical protein
MVREGASILGYMYIACLVIFMIILYSYMFLSYWIIIRERREHIFKYKTLYKIIHKKWIFFILRVVKVKNRKQTILCEEM